MEKKWFIGIDISKKTLDVVIYVPTKKHADETNYERFNQQRRGLQVSSLLVEKEEHGKEKAGH